MTNDPSSKDFELINGLAKGLNCCCDENFNRNTAAITLARMLCEGKSKNEVADIVHFINVLLAAVRTYI